MEGVVFEWGLKEEQQELAVSKAVRGNGSVKRQSLAALPLGTYEAQRAEIPYLSKPYFPHLYDGVIIMNRTYFIVLLILF